jgi:hypothetical protein
MTEQRCYRNLLCPVCGAVLSFDVDPKTGNIPGEYLMPRHEPRPGSGVNLCAGYRITVTIAQSKCEKCGRPMADHPSGLCMRCYGNATPPHVAT